MSQTIYIRPIALADSPQSEHGAAIRLGIEAVGGAATGRIVDCVTTEGTVVHYGSMSGEDPRVGRSNLIYRGIKLTGFMLGRGLARRDAAKIREIYAELAAQVVAGTLYAPVDTVYPIEKIKEALAHADAPGHAGDAVHADPLTTEAEGGISLKKIAPAERKF